MRERRRPLSFICITATFNGIFVHRKDRFWLNWKLLSLDIIDKLFELDPIIKISINMIAKFTDAFHRNLQRLVPLIEILRWTVEVA